MVLILAKEQPKAIKTEGPGWLGSTEDQGPALPSPACLQNGTNPRRPDPWTRERPGTARGSRMCARSTAVLRQPTTLQVSPTARPANVPRPQDLYSGTCDQESILLPRWACVLVRWKIVDRSRIRLRR